MRRFTIDVIKIWGATAASFDPILFLNIIESNDLGFTGSTGSALETFWILFG
jgi:hypothetical protein